MLDSLKENIIATAHEDGEIISGILAERLIREREWAVDEIERLTAENERLRALITAIAERHSRVGDLEYDDVIAAAVSGCQQQPNTEK